MTANNSTIEEINVYIILVSILNYRISLKSSITMSLHKAHNMLLLFNILFKNLFENTEILFFSFILTLKTVYLNHQLVMPFIGFLLNN